MMMMTTTTPISIASTAYNYVTPKAQKATEAQAAEDRKLIALLTNKDNFQLVDSNKDGIMDKWEVDRFVKLFDKKTKDSGEFADLKGAFTRVQNFQRDLTFAKMGDADKAKQSVEVFGISRNDISKIANDFKYWDNTNAEANKGKGLDVLSNWYAQQALKDKANTFAAGQNSYSGLTGWINAQQAQYDDPIHNKILKSSNEKSTTDKTTEKPKAEGFNWLNALLIGGLGFLGGRLLR
jgi:hypothetical protein